MVTVRAIYENGKLRLLDEVDLEEGQEFEIILKSTSPNEIGERVFGLHRGMGWISDDFDEPLPDSFWLGSETDSLNIETK
jgi:predicted DNA-binding antitoxin AbrB/MazE fold protein